MNTWKLPSRLLALVLCVALAPISNASDEPDAATSTAKLSSELRAVIDAPEFKHAHWGILVVDLASGEVLYEHDADKLFAPASTTKLFSVAAALNELGPDYRFQTPVVRRGEVNDSGELEGDLIFVASGDFSLGGRTDAEGHIAFTNSDHTYANGSSSTELTPQDPLTGLDELAKQVANAGIRRVRGDVIVDARLFDEAESTGSGPSRVTPIVVNDNLIDVTITPTDPRAPAKIEWRPECVGIEVDAQVETAPAGATTEVHISSAGHDKIVVRGQIAADHAPVIRVQEVSDPASFARTLFIEALDRAGVAVDATLLRPNAADNLPPADEARQLPQVAVFESPEFSESARLILKVSHNLHASMLPLLIAARHDKRSLAAGLRQEHEFLTASGIAADTISFGGGAGGSPADLTTPRATVELLRYMATRPDFQVYERALPVLGVDGTLSNSVGDDSPAKGKAQAKTGTYYWHNMLNGRYVLTSKALAGYLTAKSGRRLAFSVMVNGVHLKNSEERNRIGRVLGRVCEVVYEGQ
jgi:D-alanyl-D-alanine carboxypeptidase/D-alanyl-D-alanine-endopeptidase (penicillin-binding protein 4)